MILQCPSCQAKFNVPDSAIGAAGRNVKCAKCGHGWHAMPVAAPIMSAPAMDEQMAQFFKTPAAPVLNAAKKVEKVDVVAAKIVFNPVLTGSLAAAFIFALICTILANKPGWFGLTPTHDVAFVDIGFAKQATNKGVEYGVSGKLINLSDVALPMPKIRIMLVDNEGSPLKSWSPEGKERLDAKEEMTFNFAPLSTSLTSGDRLVLDMGSSNELMLRAKP